MTSRHRTTARPVSRPDELGLRRSAVRRRDAIRIELATGRSARSIISQLRRVTRDLPDHVAVVVVSVDSVEALTVDLLTGVAVGRRLLAAQGRHLVLRIPGTPTTPGSAALVATMPFVLVSEPTVQRDDHR